MKFFLPFILTWAAMAADTAQSSYAAEFGKRWTATRKLAVGVADAMPANEYAFKPDPPSMDFGEQMVHIAVINYAFCAALKDEKSPATAKPKEKTDFVELMGDSFDYCSAQITSVSEAQMNTIHSTPDGKLNGRELLLALYVHLAHHRGQAEIYLRIKGIKPPPYVF